MNEEEKAAAELAAENSNDATEINDEDLLAAVSAAVDEETIKPETNDDDDSADDDAELDDTGAADDDAGANADEELSEKPEGDGADATGDKPEDGEPADSGDAVEKTADKPKEADKDASDAGADVTDHVNDPIPESTNEKTAARIKGLIGLVKEHSGATEQRDEIIDRINDSGADPDQYANTLGFLKLYNSPNMDDRKQALAVVRGMVKELALDVGEGASVTKLSDHDDLQAEVEAGTLTEKRAVEIAATRERQTQDDARTTAANEKTNTATQTQENIAVGTGQLNELEIALRVSEKDYEELRPMFLGLLKPVIARTHPSEWGNAAREVFDQIRLVRPVAVTPKPKPKPTNTPLRPKQGAGGGSGKKLEGGSVMDAMNEAIDNA